MPVDHSNFIEGVFRIQNASEFESMALELFRHQAEHNNVYATYLDMLKIQVESIHEFDDIPFLPIEFFKSHQVVTGSWTPEAVFHSSGTSSDVVSKHQVKELSVYRNSFTSGFKEAYGEPGDYIILCLLPNYSDNPNSSLIYMTDELIELSGQE